MLLIESKEAISNYQIYVY